MSVVTGVTIVSQCCDEMDMQPLIDRLNDWIGESFCSGGKFRRVDHHYGGTKHPECLVWGGGFNYLPDVAFIEYAKTLDWRGALTCAEEEMVCMIVSLDQHKAEIVLLT